MHLIAVQRNSNIYSIQMFSILSLLIFWVNFDEIFNEMFFFGLSASVLPYIISIVAIWTGIILGYSSFVHPFVMSDAITEKTIHIEVREQGIDASVAQFPQILRKSDIQKDLIESCYFYNTVVFPEPKRTKFYSCDFFQANNGHLNLPDNKAPPKSI